MQTRMTVKYPIVPFYNAFWVYNPFGKPAVTILPREVWASMVGWVLQQDVLHFICGTCEMRVLTAQETSFWFLLSHIYDSL